MSRGSNLGEFEELVLLAVASLTTDAYGYAVQARLREEAKRSVGLATVHSALYRLEKKGLLNSELGGSTAARGGRRKRLFQITSTGRAAVREKRSARNTLWELMPEVKPA